MDSRYFRWKKAVKSKLIDTSCGYSGAQTQGQPPAKPAKTTEAAETTEGSASEEVHAMTDVDGTDIEEAERVGVEFDDQIISNRADKDQPASKIKDGKSDAKEETKIDAHGKNKDEKSDAKDTKSDAIGTGTCAKDESCEKELEEAMEKVEAEFIKEEQKFNDKELTSG